MVIAACLLCLIGFFAFRFYSDGTPAEWPVDADEAASAGDISLLAAYKLALPDAKKWRPEAQLFLITSVDDDEKEFAGTAGKRKKWNLLFANVSTEETLHVSIENGTVISTAENKEKTLENTLIRPDNMKVDSTDLIETAIRDFTLKPGVDWANGYHFSLMNNGERTALIITGLTGDGRFTQVYYDSRTGAYIGSK
ncbi:hypothetical protein [Paenibacillus macerans]|uniref:hypothetical protein n=1 Tax=Paenibacillus macerans TaxID=44252 RepID=UPI00203D2308|nr:hypothetical protein [Paenibacillus macerans]MCM3703147.1 hypothetical protein [Paenibacillus macerans]